jgi:hypothetical protein
MQVGLVKYRQFRPIFAVLVRVLRSQAAVMRSFQIVPACDCGVLALLARIESMPNRHKI